MNKQEMSDVAKQICTILEYVEPEVIKRIPSNIIEYFKKLGKESEIELKLEIGKGLNEQDILEETKDLLALIFYLYIAEENEKKEIMRRWSYNEEQYKEILKEKYQINFKKTEQVVPEIKEEKSLVIQEGKIKLFYKIKQFIYRIFKTKTL